MEADFTVQHEKKHSKNVIMHAKTRWGTVAEISLSSKNTLLTNQGWVVCPSSPTGLYECSFRTDLRQKGRVWLTSPRTPSCCEA